MRRVWLICALVFCPVSAWAASNVLTWTDNSTNEQGFKIERKIVPTPAGNPLPPPLCPLDTAPYVQLATTGLNVATFTDSAVQEGVAYCYRVRAYNTAGDTTYTNEAGRSIPFTAPNGVPSQLTVIGGP